MRISRIAALLVLTAVAGATAAAKDGEKPKTEKPKLVCRTEAVTGSLLRKRRVCLTQQQWDELASNTKQDLDRFGNGLTSNAPSGTNPAAPQ